MHRLFKQYNAKAPYDGGGIPEEENLDASKLTLDPIDCAGQADTLAILTTARARGLCFAESIATILYWNLFLTILIAPFCSLERHSDYKTNSKWKDHLSVLAECGILIATPEAEIKHFARYFAVPKDTVKARAIVNLKQLSRSCKPPLPTNLPEVGKVLEIIQGGKYFLVGDFRHYFHQFKVISSVSKFFGISCGSRTYTWATLPMGFSHSPRIAQCASWAVLLEAAFRAKLADPKTFGNLHNPPAFAKIKGGYVLVWYDNVLGVFSDSNARDAYHRALMDVCSEKNFNISIKHLDTYSARKMVDRVSPDTAEDDRLYDSLPKYLGMEISSEKRTIGENAYKIVWRHDRKRVTRWNDLKELGTTASSRKIARAVGVILWDCTISGRHLCSETAVIDILKQAAAKVRQLTAEKRERPWDVPTEWNHDTVTYLRERVIEISDKNPWRQLTLPCTTKTVRAATDACGASSQTGNPGGWGYVIWSDSTLMEAPRNGSFGESQKTMHIYLREMLAATLCVEQLATTTENTRILLGIDNTAVVWALRAMYSSNIQANEMLRRVARALDRAGNLIEVVPLRSVDNPADAPSRDLDFSYDILKNCNAIMDQHELGLTRVEAPAEVRPDFTGALRHETPEDEPMTDLLMDEALDFDELLSI